ncbi:MAG: DUF4037 domain-containing protein [Anaerolineaceae bacterium]|nr:DUF4037 domain-containing protein [Anaerolineaceae bacterium]
MEYSGSESEKLAKRLGDRFAQIDSVEAVALGGSQAVGAMDGGSDIDLYVFSPAPVSLTERAQIVSEFGASRADLNLTFWDTGDEWFHAETGIEVDVMFWSLEWIEGQLHRVLRDHTANMGYTTCHWHTIRNARVLFDRQGRFDQLKAYARQEYPEALRTAIIRKNYPILRTVIPAYVNQIEKALKRGDWVSVQHRAAELLASYFDILFALNRLPHPGEKRLAQKVLTNCVLIPNNFESDLDSVLRGCVPGGVGMMGAVTKLLDHLDDVLIAEGIDPVRKK